MVDARAGDEVAALEQAINALNDANHTLAEAMYAATAAEQAAEPSPESGAETGAESSEETKES